MYLIRYYLANQSRLFSEPMEYVAKDGDDLDRFINIVGMGNYVLVSVDEIKDGKLIPII